ncbi:MULTISPECIES: hypothetical protein [Aerosakkonema]|uniref:hypothetical protein n=1 Tax=Aerosakkonema TaxID=1246629 RepID=UPI0035BABB05
MDSHVERTGILGLLEISNPQAELHYRVPRILASLLEFPADAESIYRTAGQFLYRLWWKSRKLLQKNNVWKFIGWRCWVKKQK